MDTHNLQKEISDSHYASLFLNLLQQWDWRMTILLPLATVVFYSFLLPFLNRTARCPVSAVLWLL
jgi:hypothetical protein